MFFITTFASIYDRALPLMEEKKGNGEIIVVASTGQIERFFREYTDFRVIRIRVHPDLITLKTKHKILFNIIRSKMEFRKLFKDVKGVEVYFCNEAYALVIYSYIKKLSKKNKVIFYGERTMRSADKHGLRDFMMRWVARWLMGVDTTICNISGTPFWQLDEKFFDGIEYLEYMGRDRGLLDKYAKRLDFLQGKRILVAIEDSVAAGSIEKSEFVDKMDQVVDILDKVAPGEYIIKPHPRLDRLYGKMSKGVETVPSHIPIEFIMNHDWKAVIGINSFSLISATDITNAKVISLIEAVDFIDDNSKKMFYEWMVGKKIEILDDVKDLENRLIAL